MENEQDNETIGTVGEWADSEPLFYDRTAAYDEHIQPLVMQLYDLCKEHKIPMVTRCWLANTENGISCQISRNMDIPVGEMCADMVAFSILQDLTPDALEEVKQIMREGMLRMAKHNPEEFVKRLLRDRSSE